MIVNNLPTLYELNWLLHRFRGDVHESQRFNHKSTKQAKNKELQKKNGYISRGGNKQKIIRNFN